MTLEEKIRPHAQYWDCYNDCSLEYNHTGKLIKIAETFAIEFMCWCEENKGWISKYTNEQKMIIYKNEINTSDSNGC